MYNLKNDIGETNNLANQYPNEVKRLYSILTTWESELIEPTFLGLIHTPAWKNKGKKKK